jgi:FixJ family two-component response regulator
MGQARSYSWSPAIAGRPGASRSVASEVAPIVFVVDDDAPVRESLESLIEAAGWQAETFATAMEFLACPRPRSPSCLVLDVLLPDLNGLDLQDRINAEHVLMPIIFVTGCGDVPTTVRAMKGGAADFLTKPFRDDVLLAAIAGALDLSRAALSHEADLRVLRERHASLSRREREVLALVVAGRLNKQIAADLGISEITVKAHRGSMMRKMEARSLPHLVNLASRLGIGADFAADAPAVRGGPTLSTRGGYATPVCPVTRPFSPGRQANSLPSSASRWRDGSAT